MSLKKHYLISAPIILLTIFLDQLTKTLFSGKAFTLIKGVISIEDNPVLNTGAAWGVFSGRVGILIVLSVLFLLFFTLISHKLKDKTSLYSVSYALVMGGAVGNLIDRFFLKGVRDFIKFDFINFPIFNLADSFLVIGVALFAVFVFFVYPKDEEKTKAKEKQ